MSKQTYTNAAILRVSLTDGSIRREQISPDDFAHYLGGRGLGVKILYENLPPRIDPLSPDNWLIFAVGPMTATSVPTAGRFVVVTKSPLTGTIFDSHAGGYFGAHCERLAILQLFSRVLHPHQSIFGLMMARWS